MAIVGAAAQWALARYARSVCIALAVLALAALFIALALVGEHPRTAAR